jgi:hypothetical protein
LRNTALYETSIEVKVKIYFAKQVIANKITIDDFADEFPQEKNVLFDR